MPSTNFIGSVSNNNPAFPAAFAAAALTNKSTLVVFSFGGSAVNPGLPTTMSFGGIPVPQVMMHAFARVNGAGTDNFRSLAVGIMPLDGQPLSNNLLVLGWTGVASSSYMLLFDNVDPAAVLANLLQWNTLPAFLTDPGGGLSYVAHYPIPLQTAEAGDALVEGAHHIFQAIGGAALWQSIGFVGINPDTGPPPYVQAMHAQGLAAGATTHEMTISAGFSNAVTDIAPAFSLRLPVAPVPCYDVTNFNCTAFPDPIAPVSTLAEYRVRMLRRLGFAANAANPPPGMVDMLTVFLQDAQDFLFLKWPGLSTRWIFFWNLLPGVRFYGLKDNLNTNGDLVHLDAYKDIQGVYLVDQNGTWLPMHSGIPPLFYTTVNQPGLPVRYEIRQCIEIFPAPPDLCYHLAIKGNFGKQPFAADTDKPTVHGELVYLWALANALDYYGKPSAAGVATQAKEYLGQLVAGTHSTKRYVPGERPLAPAVQPLLLPGDFP